ncbi:copper homeostasis protein-like protein cutC [Plenodomus tracheiphilus IPT5]|uniref:Copper homeostasis protein cutC homolog n=1 Tax=Plenodomus tracheiphilus IPT5 TaxID=1408161 RepID=A0A6A7AR52_9PLEO|nr:copper homeostasis protein-like protein cutC [Plenodomus tracheiphilus IPT5]
MLEIACFNLPSVYAAANAGADQIELCADYEAGGVTPPAEWGAEILTKPPGVPVKVMIRPRGGDFLYSTEEFEQMKKSIIEWRHYVKGYVFGILDANDQFDEVRNRELVELAKPLPCTFHRAIDKIGATNGYTQWEIAAQSMFTCGFKSILSGGDEDGACKVRSLQSRFGGQFIILYGGGVRSSNIEEATRASGEASMHSSAITQPGEDVDVDEVRKMRDILLCLRESRA